MLAWEGACGAHLVHGVGRWMWFQERVEDFLRHQMGSHLVRQSLRQAGKKQDWRWIGMMPKSLPYKTLPGINLNTPYIQKDMVNLPNLKNITRTNPDQTMITRVWVTQLLSLHRTHRENNITSHVKHIYLTEYLRPDLIHEFGLDLNRWFLPDFTRWFRLDSINYFLFDSTHGL